MELRGLGLARALTAMIFACAVSGCNGSLELGFGETLCDDEIGCPDGSVCIEGVCVLDADGTIAPPTAVLPEWEPGSEPQPDPDALARCRITAQCASGEVCFDGRCIEDTCGGIECPGNTVCRPSCRPTENACDGVECTEGVTYCLNGACVPLCTNDPCTLNGCFPGSPGCIENVGAGEDDPEFRCAGTDSLPMDGSVEPVTRLECDDVEGCREVPVAEDAAVSCQFGRCVAALNPSTVTCDDRACGPGSACVVECLPPDPCVPNPCNSGWRCQDLGEAGFACIPLTCSGISCPEGEVCVNGSCQDTCANQPCELGGDLCCTDIEFADDDNLGSPGAMTAGEKLAECQSRSTCCNRTCCPYDFQCVEGSCVPPMLDCDPACEDDELCLTDGCSCGPQTDEGPVQCDDDACCVTDIDTSNAVDGEQGCVERPCDTPVVPGGLTGAQFCENDPTRKGCERDCLDGDGPGFRCVDLCDGVSCTAPDTCDPSTGRCSCGGVQCESDECCISDTCTPVCDGECTAASDGRCETRCGSDPAFACVDQCIGAGCGVRNPDCDPKVGDCFCDADPTDRTCNNNQCCTATGCENPCATANCGALDCEVACSEPNGFRCVDRCIGVNCPASNPANPVCIQSTGQCRCDPAEPPCAGSECCVGGTCTSVCDEDSTACSTGPNRECVADCTVPAGFRCEDFCDGVTCTGATSCDPIDGLCKCPGDLGNPAAGACVGNAFCCSGPGNTCERPCDDEPCSAGGGDGVSFECNVNCAATGGFVCENACDGINCDTQPRSQPFRVCDPVDGDCKCQGFVSGDSQCINNNQCCTGLLSGALVCETNPCSPNPCARNNDGEAFADAGNFPNNWTRCVRNCDELSSSGTEVLGYECRDRCDGVSCSVDGASCDVDDGDCKCGGDGGDECTGANRCCEGSSCVNPCAGNPCGNAGLCEVDCSAPNNRRCVDQCVAQSRVCGEQPNPDCNPVNAQCRCGTVADGFDNCNGNECCFDNACDNPCQPNPCSAAAGACVRDCSIAAGFRCVNQCGPTSCGDQPNPDCAPATGDCGCDESGSFEECGGNECCLGAGCVDPCAGANPCPDAGDGPNERRCNRDCAAPGGFTCDDSCLANNPCDPGSNNPLCDGADSSCFCEPDGTVCTGSEICCQAPGVDNQCVVPDTRPCAGDPSCVRDPCSGVCASPVEGVTCPG